MTGERPIWISVAGVVALFVTAVSLLWLAAETSYRSCVEGVTARYPPIAVSAFSRAQTGPLKVAYDAERTKALKGCDHLPG